MPRRRRKRGGISDGVAGGLLILLGLVLIGGLAAGAWWLRTSRPLIDEATNCPVSGPHLVQLILVDRSDPISGQQALRIRQIVDQVKEDAKFGDRFDFYVFEGDSKAVLEPVLSICSPGNPKDANELYQNPEMIRRRYEERFAKAIERTIDDLVQESERPISPIIESIRAAALSSFGPIHDNNVPLHVILVSDMIQHSDAVSHYRSEPDFRKLASEHAWPQLRPNLNRTKVDILYLLRPNAQRGGSPIQNRGHQLFWEEYVAASGGVIERIEPL